LPPSSGLKNPRTRNQLEKVAGSSLADLLTLKMEAICSSETSVHTRSTRRYIPEDGVLHSHRRENLKSYTSYDRTILNPHKQQVDEVVLW
jgi:hypothetical protein